MQSINKAQSQKLRTRFSSFLVDFHNTSVYGYDFICILLTFLYCAFLEALQKKDQPEAVRSALATVVIPSHVVSQVVAFPVDFFTVFVGQGEHKSPFLKYPAWQTVSVRNC